MLWGCLFSLLFFSLLSLLLSSPFSSIHVFLLNKYHMDQRSQSWQYLTCQRWNENIIFPVFKDIASKAETHFKIKIHYVSEDEYLIKHLWVWTSLFSPSFFSSLQSPLILDNCALSVIDECVFLQHMCVHSFVSCVYMSVGLQKALSLSALSVEAHYITL